MLKIKADKMCELEKMGFNESPNFWFYKKEGCECRILKKNNDKYDAEERAVYLNADYVPNIIYDLIKADMVEVCDD